MKALVGRSLHAVARALVLAALLLGCLGAAGAAEGKSLRGIALVVGQSAYRHLGPLPNPRNDAREIGKYLTDLGFEVDVTTDADLPKLKRSLRRFVEDAEDADVALLYYSGHGIEAGGENFLVPVDAEPSALASAEESLVALSPFLSQLEAAAPLGIVLLDACRSNPFPPGATITLGGAAAAPAAVSAIGLGMPRGAKALTSDAAGGAESYGTVIGFAAAPGTAALDGPAGGMSPYASALLRHLAALAGQEFGAVLRMVGEEVYLKTAGRQRPWVNENLRRLLYFGRAADAPEGEDGEILRERRSLLLTIAALPDLERRRVESAADAGGVPLDALYAMLSALGQDAPKDPDRLESLLRDQAGRVKAMISERNALKSTDPEIARLVTVADRALSEGALRTAIALFDQAKVRVGALDKALDQTEADLGRRRAEFAAVYARSAEAKALALKYREAAEDFDLAFEQVERWDARQAWAYKRSAVEALVNQGDLFGDRDALLAALASGDSALGRARAADDPVGPAMTKLAMARAEHLLGERGGESARLDRSIALYGEAVAALPADEFPVEWAGGQNDMANAMVAAGEQRRDEELLRQAVGALESLATFYETRNARAEWATVQNNLGKARGALASLTRSLALYGAAASAFESALAQTSPETEPLRYALLANNIGTVFDAVAELDPTSPQVAEYHDGAAEAFRHGLEVLRKDTAPVPWAVLQSNLAHQLYWLGYAAGQDDDIRARLEDAIAAHEAALGVLTVDNWRPQWLRAQRELGDSWQKIGEIAPAGPEKDVAFRRAAGAYRAALSATDRERDPSGWGALQHDLGRSLMHRADASGDLQAGREAEEAYRAALGVRSRDRDPLAWALSSAGLANARAKVATLTADRSGLLAARRMTEEVRAAILPLDGQYDGILAARLAAIDAALPGMK